MKKRRNFINLLSCEGLKSAIQLVNLRTAVPESRLFDTTSILLLLRRRFPGRFSLPPLRLYLFRHPLSHVTLPAVSLSSLGFFLRRITAFESIPGRGKVDMCREPGDTCPIPLPLAAPQT